MPDVGLTRQTMYLLAMARSRRIMAADKSLAEKALQSIQDDSDRVFEKAKVDLTKDDEAVSNYTWKDVTPIETSPAEAPKTVFIIHHGRVVAGEVFQDFGSWVHVALPDGSLQARQPIFVFQSYREAIECLARVSSLIPG